MRRRWLSLLLTLLVVPKAVAAQMRAESNELEPPPVPRELRGVWVATVNNIDWPSRRDLTVNEQKLELITILDAAKLLRLNLVIFQVRPAADAFYASPVEPWSEFLTGQMGRAPEPFYDPLQFAIEEAHRRGLELHAWFNPFRARYSTLTPAAPSHISQTRPDLVKRYGDFLWLDPGERDAREYSLRVLLDVVNRYDIDGVHIDDYFYPYQAHDSRGRLIPFPDEQSYARYRAAGGLAARDDWRRDNINNFVRELYSRVKTAKPWVKVGISPFGIWRSGYPPSVSGLDAFSEIYADARTWLRQGWLDYIVPQLYWPIDAPQQSYTALLEWWVQQNLQSRHVWAGNAPYRVLDGRHGWPVREIINQVRLTRAEPGASGNVFFSMASLLRNRGGLSDSLVTEVYRDQALPPRSTWLDANAPTAPTLRVDPHLLLRATLAIQSTGTEPAFLWIVRSRFGDQWFTQVMPGSQLRFLLLRAESPRLPDEVAVSAVDRSGNESEISRVFVR